MKSIKTVNLKANEIQAVEMPDLHCHVRNGGTATVFASRYADVAPYTDGVLEIKSGDSKVVRNIFDYQTRQGFVYLFSEFDTSVELESANDVNFFSRKIISGGESAGSVDTYNRSEIDTKLSEKADNSDIENVSNAVNTHVNTTSVHMTTTEKEKLVNLENYDDNQIKNDIALNLSSIGMSKKNLLPYRFVSGNAGGAPVTVDNDGTLNLSGTTKTSLTYNLNFPTPLVFDRDVFIIGATSLTNIHYNCKVDTKINGSLYPAIGTKGLLIPAGTKIEYLYVQQTTTGTTVSATIQPMICYADVIDKSYEPYTPDLQTQITKNDNDIALNTSSIGMSRKNLLKVTGATQELNGVTFTVNDDGSITVSGKNTSDTTTFYRITNLVKLPIGGSYTLNGCPANNKNDDGTTKVYWRVEKQGSVIAMDTGNGKTFTTSENANPTMAQICVYAGADFTDNPVTFYPMIRYSDVTDDTYEPYTPSVQEQINDILARLTTGGL